MHGLQNARERRSDEAFRLFTEKQRSSNALNEQMRLEKKSLSYLGDLNQLFGVTSPALDNVVDTSDVLHRDSDFASPGFAVFVSLADQGLGVVLASVRRNANLWKPQGRSTLALRVIGCWS